jgi:hypothetical protein
LQAIGDAHILPKSVCWRLDIALMVVFLIAVLSYLRGTRQKVLARLATLHTALSVVPVSQGLPQVSQLRAIQLEAETQSVTQ